MPKKCKNQKLYTFIKHKRIENSGVSPLNSNGSTYTDTVHQATALNLQFESVFSRPKTLSLKFLAELELWLQGPNPKNVKIMPAITMTTKVVEGLLKGLNPNKASGRDEISPRFLKELHDEIASILSKLYRSSISAVIVPNDWELSW